MQFILSRGKRVNEKLPIGVDFTDDLEDADSVSSAAVTAIDGAGADVTATILEGAVLAGNISKITVKAGTEGESYRVFFKATTAAGFIYTHSVLIPVRLNS